MFANECVYEAEGFASVILSGFLLRENQLAPEEREGEWIRVFSSVHGMDSSDWDSARRAITGLCAGFDEAAAKKFDGIAGQVEEALRIYEGSRGLGRSEQLRRFKEFVGAGYSAESHYKGLPWRCARRL